MTPPGTPGRASRVCFMHDTRHLDLEEPKVLIKPSRQLAISSFTLPSEDKSSHVQQKAYKYVFGNELISFSETPLLYFVMRSAYLS